MADVERVDVLVIGGGSGLTAAHYALQDDRSAALVEARPEFLGGTCLTRGCIPTKQIIQSTHVMRVVRAAGDFGVELDQSSVQVDFGRIMRSMRERRETSSGKVRSWVEDKMTPVFERVRFVGEKRIETESGRLIEGERVFIACGGKPTVPPIAGIENVDYLTNEGVLDLEEQPERIVIVGGGYIGCEFAHFFEGLGSVVTIVQSRDRLLPDEDEEISELFTEAFKERATLYLGARAEKVRKEYGAVVLTLESGEEVRGDALVVATGRESNAESLELGATGVEIDEKGWIKVDEHLRTTHRDVFAYGDCIGKAMFKHTSSFEGKLAYDNAFGAERVMDYTANPHAVFSEPQVAGVGLTEQACREMGLKYRTASKPYDSIAKGEIVGSPPGVCKAIVEEGTGRVLGCHIAGPNAVLMIHEVVAVMARGGTAADIAGVIHVHPSMGELVEGVFGSF